ncbi:hypothetical protein PRIPAC_71279 [Pristionchus pacificus]|uniref:Uncharacterized protein n=1 Tax=Pristionchus pacificus TaxID=54126 RepID=A0A2A6C5Z2_PRIPA|nr:hypothetical protein PRIPAC_71279 [Pristionchus pacificus]|eukprot:PDM73536.1 hypothetical protein PRIPAC_40892 [Pristionchus pacificus]
MLNRLVLASLSLWIGAIAYYWLAKLREIRPCDPNQAPEIFKIVKRGEKSFRASNAFHAKLPNISKRRRYKDFKQVCLFRGVVVIPSLTHKGLWHFSYTVERPTLDEVLEDERKMSKIVHDELRELAKLENFSKFLRWFKYAK